MSETTNGQGNDVTHRRRFGAGTLIIAALAAALAAGGGGYLLAQRTHSAPAGAPGGEATKEQYLCPMHPNIVDDHASNCPICGMKLVKAGSGAAKSGAAAAHDTYQCPMHPDVVQDHPGNCPVCGMKLVRVQPEDAPGAGAAPVDGLATVEIDPARQQLIGLTTAQARRAPVGGAWRTVGRVAVDETRVRHINVKVPGYVERIHVDFVGKPVKKGDPLFSYYSPELLAAQEEYLLALRTRASLEKAGGGGADGDALVAAARRKLALWDVPQSQIDRVAQTGEPSRTLTFYSPVSGVVVKKDVVEGMKLDAGAMPYELVDLSQVWVLADVYESELRHMRVGMPATLTLEAYPNREFEGRVAFIDPLMDPQSRTVKVRVSFANGAGMLRPEMFGEVVLHGPKREGLVVPADAIIDSGREKVVFVALGGGRFQPRVVRAGETDGQNVEVVDGLSEGERVVTRANFLVDSESRLRASLSELQQGAKPQPERARVLPGGEAPAKEQQQEQQQPAPGAPGRDAAPDRGPGGHGGHGGHSHGTHKS